MAVFQLETLSIQGWPFRLQCIIYGQGTRLQLEVIYSEHDRTPDPTQLRTAWKARQNHRGVPLLVVVLHDGKAHVCGPSGEDPTVYTDLDAGQVERICQEAFEQPSRQAALRALRDSLSALEEEGLPGLRNEGFLASHELAQENIWRNWDFYTDPSNLQPKVRKLNREVDTFLLDSSPTNVEQVRLDRVSETLMSPWPIREENKLREVWKEEHPSNQAKALALIEVVESTGIEPFEQPQRFLKIDRDEIRLICWLVIQAEPRTDRGSSKKIPAPLSPEVLEIWEELEKNEGLWETAYKIWSAGKTENEKHDGPTNVDLARTMLASSDRGRRPSSAGAKSSVSPRRRSNPKSNT